MDNQTQKKWIIWKTIEIGTYHNTENLIEALKAINITINEWAEYIMRKDAFKLSQKKEKIDLILVKLSDLNLKPRAKWGEIYSAANSLGLKLCPNEIGPVLRLLYKNQPRTQSIIVAMEPIKDQHGLELVFGIWKDKHIIRLSYAVANAQAHFDPKDYLVFTK